MENQCSSQSMNWEMPKKGSNFSDLNLSGSRHEVPECVETPPASSTQNKRHREQMIHSLHYAYQQALHASSLHQANLKPCEIFESECDCFEESCPANQTRPKSTYSSQNPMLPYEFPPQLPVIPMHHHNPAHLLMKQELNLMNSNRSSQGSLPYSGPSMNQLPFWPYSQPMQYQPTMPPHLPPPLYSIPHHSGIPSLGPNGMNSHPSILPTAPLHIAPTFVNHIPSSRDVAYLHQPIYSNSPVSSYAMGLPGSNTTGYNSHLVNQGYGFPSGMDVNNILGLNMQQNSVYEAGTPINDEDEKRKANQRRRKAESRKRLREQDPVGYREKEARARRDRRMKQKARMNKELEASKLSSTESNAADKNASDKLKKDELMTIGSKIKSFSKPIKNSSASSSSGSMSNGEDGTTSSEYATSVDSGQTKEGSPNQIYITGKMDKN